MDKLRAGLLTGREARLLLLLAGARLFAKPALAHAVPLMSVIMDDMRIGYQQGGLTLLYTGYSSYLPSFLAEARGFSMRAGGTATCMISVAGLAG